MTGFEEIAVVTGVVTISGGILGFTNFVRNLNKDRELAKEVINSKIDNGLKRIEDRSSAEMTNLRTEIMASYVNTKVCEIVHRNSDASIVRIEENISKIFDKLELLTQQILDILQKK